MEQRQQKSAFVLKYAKRRFDGGSEVDLIRSIEVAQMNKMYNSAQGGVGNSHQSFSAPLSLAPAATEQAVVQKPVVYTPQTRMWEAAMRGPLQLCIGVVGMLTAVLAIITFRRANNQPMLDQSLIVFKDCRQTFLKGFLDCFTTPVRVVKAGLKKA